MGRATHNKPLCISLAYITTLIITIGILEKGGLIITSLQNLFSMICPAKWPPQNPSWNTYKTHEVSPFPVVHHKTPSLSQPHFEGVVRSPLTLPKIWLGSPPGLPKTQSTIAGVKTPCIEAFFIPLERSWNVDVQNGLVWAIWTSSAQVMVERRVRSQTTNLTPDH